MNNGNSVELGTLSSNELIDLRNISDKVEPLKTNIGEANRLVKDIQQRLDQRLTDKYVDYFAELNNHVSVLENDITNLASFKTWLDAEIAAAEATEVANQEAVKNEEEYEGNNKVDDTNTGDGNQSQDLQEQGVDNQVGNANTGDGDKSTDLTEQDVDNKVSGTKVGDAVDPINVKDLGVDNGVTGTTPGVSSGTAGIGAAEIATGVAGVAAGASGEVSEIDDELAENYEEPEHKYITPVTDPLEEYQITTSDYEGLTDEEKQKIKEMLRLVGYSEDDIEKYMNGGMSLPKIVVSNVGNALEEALRDNPDLRQKLIDRYGFDVFYEDGSVDPTKLASALLIDGKNSNDGYDMISMLANDYDIDLIDRGSLGQFANQINNAMEENPELRKMLEQKYGFDIFNADGTINEEKLRYALMIDGFDSVDDLDLINSLYGCYGIDVEALGAIDNLSLKLLDELEKNPALRQQIIDKYGFDVFNEDGSVNMDKLKYMLMLDTFDKDNKLDFLNILHGNEMGNLSTESLDKLSVQLLSALELDPEQREYLKGLYGFDIFNDDGTVNMERLKYALMLDGFDLEDDLDITKYLGDFLGKFVTDTETIKKKKGNPIPIIAGIGLAAASAGAGYTIYKKNKDEEEQDDEDELYQDEDADFDDSIDI